MDPATLLAVLLSLMPPLRYARCVERHRAEIAATAADAERAAGVPAGVLLAVGLLESQWGCDPRSGGSWGNPRDARHRNLPGRPAGAARILARGFALYGTWGGALAHFRCGRRACPPLVGYEPGDALRLAARLYAGAGVPLPAGLAASATLPINPHAAAIPAMAIRPIPTTAAVDQPSGAR